MVSRDGRHVIVFNGEVYNYRELKDALRRTGCEFQSQSDTEVLLELFAREGIGCLQKISGMFAFAVWDRVERKLVLARDPLGIKPLYYWQVGDQFAFASELRALLASDLGPRQLDPEALYGYFLNGSVQEPATLVLGIQTLPPGHILEFQDGKATVQAYWQLHFTDEIHDAEQAAKLTSGALEAAMERHFVSDVPVGIFLSGGIDSTALLALAKRIGRKEVHTFCIGFDQAAYDESDWARRTAEHFGSHHHEKRLKSREACDMLEGYSSAIDQPSIDGFNTFVVSQFARERGMKVALSGLGGDELFGSYPSFQAVPKLMRWYDYSRRMGTGPLIRFVGQFAGGYGAYSRVLRFLASGGGVGAAYQTVRSVFSRDHSASLVRWYTGQPFETHQTVDEGLRIPPSDLGDRISGCELTRYMRNQLLRDADVMSMRHGLELRVPFLDRGLVELLCRIDPQVRLRTNKQLLLDAVPEVPNWIRHRAKQGFAFPFPEWLETQWHREFAALQARVPIGLAKWYHRWALFALDTFLSANRIERVHEASSPAGASAS